MSFRPKRLKKGIWAEMSLRPFAGTHMLLEIKLGGQNIPVPEGYRWLHFEFYIEPSILKHRTDCVKIIKTLLRTAGHPDRQNGEIGDYLISKKFKSVYFEKRNKKEVWATIKIGRVRIGPVEGCADHDGCIE